MREFYSQVLDLSKGISPLPIEARNSPFMYDVYNIRVGKYGLEPPPIISTLSGMPSVLWPLPQIVNTSIGVYVMSGTKMYEVVAGTLVEVLSGFVSNRQWDVADFGKYQVWTDGTNLITRNYDDTYSLRTYSYCPYTICNYRGQLVMGGLGAGHKDWICWSNIGSVNLADMLDTVMLGVDSDDMKNTAGNRKMPFEGQIYKVLPLDTGIMVYGEGGIAGMIPVKSPAATFGMKELDAIRCNGAAGGGLYRHIFFDEDGYMLIIDDKFKLERLGYNRLFAGKSPVISYDKSTGDFYISTDTDTYLLFSGLSHIGQNVTSVARVGSSLIAPYTAESDTYAEFVTDIIDFKSRGIKTITALEVGTDDESVYVAIDYRFRGSEAFRTSSFKQVYKNGMVFPLVSGDEFRIRVKATVPANIDVSYINVRWKLVDKRVIRGLDAANDRNVSRQDS